MVFAFLHLQDSPRQNEGNLFLLSYRRSDPGGRLAQIGLVALNGPGPAYHQGGGSTDSKFLRPQRSRHWFVGPIPNDSKSTASRWDVRHLRFVRMQTKAVVQHPRADLRSAMISRPTKHSNRTTILRRPVSINPSIDVMGHNRKSQLGVNGRTSRLQPWRHQCRELLQIIVASAWQLSEH